MPHVFNKLLMPGFHCSWWGPQFFVWRYNILIY